MKLPRSVEEIAEVIGVDRALYLVGRLPRCLATRGGGKGTSWHVILYVPKRMTADHELVRILGWDDADKLRKHFGGEILHPGTCGEVYREFRTLSIQRLAAQGIPPDMLAEWFEMGPRRVRDLVAMAEITQEGRKAANDDDGGYSTRRVSR